MFLRLVIISVLALPDITLSARIIKFVNQCSEDIWLSPSTDEEGPELSSRIRKISPGSDLSYNIPDGGWGGDFWPKMGCDDTGNNCLLGQSAPPCPTTGCDPPSDTRVEFHYPAAGNGEQVFYAISLVDGYSIPVEIIPNQIGGNCTQKRCAVSLDQCPVEKDLGDLKSLKNEKVIRCLSPCIKWGYPLPFGLEKSPFEGNGVWYCCADEVTPEECKMGMAIETNYFKLLRQECPGTYAFSFDDDLGLHSCDNDVSFDVNFCENSNKTFSLKT